MFQKELRWQTLKGPLQMNWSADIFFRQNKIFKETDKDNKVLSHIVTMQFPVCANAAMFQKEQRRLTLKGPLQKNWGAYIYLYKIKYLRVFSP